MTHSADADAAPRTLLDNAGHAAALAEIDHLMTSDPPPGTPDGDRLDRLATLVRAYEARLLAEGEEAAGSAGETTIARRPGGLTGVLDAAFFDPLTEDELTGWEGGTT